MKIVDRNLSGASTTGASQAQESQRTESSAKARPGASGSSGYGDRVEFSGTLGRLSRALAADGAGRAAKVRSLAAQYQSGNYRPDSAATSRNMVSEALSAAR